MISFIYINAFLFVSVRAPDRDNQYADRNVPDFWRHTCYKIWETLLCLGLPAWIVSKSFAEAYYEELVYYPLTAAIIWFGYGCLFAWAHQAKKLKWVIPIIAIVWSVFLYMGWVANVW
jgi:hypothetical protein